ncbi:MAG: hypothetical protein QOK25_473 [Thermoleophilaceae bacterium]|jgi:hypothetical protein|nr:hypothetical protein [Thermoleophilaceae bacterium]
MRVSVYARGWSARNGPHVEGVCYQYVVMRALLASLAAVAAVALLPAAALAQNAGDQQYTDPLAGSSAHPSSHKSVTPTASTASPGSQPTAAQNATPAGSGSHAAGSKLPRSGIDVVWLGLTGVLLLGSGLALRRVTERPTA